jgi:hypothetical protein
VEDMHPAVNPTEIHLPNVVIAIPLDKSAIASLMIEMEGINEGSELAMESIFESNRENQV